MSPRGKSGNGSGRGRGGNRGSGQGYGDRGRGRGGNRGVSPGTRRDTDMRAPSNSARPAQPLQFRERVLSRPSGPASSEKEIEMLMAQVDTMTAQLQDVYARISVLQGGNTPDSLGVADVHGRRRTSNSQDGGRAVAVVDEEECVSCGICADVCPEGAITVEDTTVIDSQKCTGCGSCVEACPNQAITLGVLTRAL